jgi:hypothetical protein
VLAKAGSTLWTRTTLTQYRAPSVHSVVKVGLSVPKAAAHHTAMLTVSGGGMGSDLSDLLVPTASSDGTEIDVLLDPSEGGPESLDELLTELASAPRQDAVTAQLRNPSSGRVYAEHTRRATTSLDPFLRAFPAAIS